MNDTISSTVLCQRAGITYRQVTHWRYRGLLVGDEARPGSGRQVTYPRSEIAVAAVLRVVMPFHGHGSSVTYTRLLALVSRVRAGQRGRVRIVPGVILDLDEIVGTPADPCG